MATTTANNITHVYAPNPQFQKGQDWKDVYPKIEHDGRFLRNKFTGDIVGYDPDTATRSDILEPISDEEAYAAMGVVTPKLTETTYTETGGVIPETTAISLDHTADVATVVTLAVPTMESL